MAKFDAKDPDETYTVLFDFFELLDSIDSASCAATVVTGTDTNPSAILIGLPQVSGTKVVQRVAGGLDDVQYRIRCMVTSGPDTFVLTGIQPVEVAE